ncbi:MAG: hypothetical protein KJO15_13770 [Alphaproteobacteria bacterium]|jgi:hypothetical protein|nr:hypothetical protein [Alphaproteobacteria bacterium]MBT8476053.1 hypothetical protein [Alphaproteobacteria bacterium]
MISKRSLVGSKKVAAYLDNFTWSRRDDLVDVYNQMMPSPFLGEIHENELGEIVWITDTKTSMAIFDREEELRRNFELILKNWDK